jgi:hypothetical protein
MGNLRLAPSVRDLRGQAVEAILARLARIDLSPLLVYRIDSVPASALPWLGWQFDLLSPLWQLLAPAAPSAQTEADAARRALIKLGISLHRMRGTPAAIKTALTRLGWENPSIQEGQASWGGSSWPANQGWAVCRLLVTPPTLDPANIPAWDPTGATNYGAGSAVSYNGLYFVAVADVPAGLPPQYPDLDAVPDFDQLTNVDYLVPYPWYLVVPPITRTLVASDAETVSGVFEFFKPARCWLDSVWFVMPPFADSAPAPEHDALVITGIGELGADAAPPPGDATPAISVALGAMSENYLPIAPLQNAHFKQKGHNQGANQPLLADGPLVINGVTDGTSS